MDFTAPGQAQVVPVQAAVRAALPLQIRQTGTGRQPKEMKNDKEACDAEHQLAQACSLESGPLWSTNYIAPHAISEIVSEVLSAIIW